MKPYGLNELREKFLSYFEEQGHLRLESFSLIPKGDKSLLLINSGMAPLKPYFTGQETPPRKRVTTCQKCIRTPDIENVGKTARHGTFFEMLGNFSFGDYFKKEAIRWSWDFLTDVLEIPKDLLYVTVYEDDDEAAQLWQSEVGLDPSRIVRMGAEDNFWEIGTGPCGPCSEIYVDRGEKYSCGKEGCGVGCDCDRYVEVWNLVFTQFNKDDMGNYNPLANPNIDTGMGLERLAVFCQGVDNLFEVDTIRYILDYICEIAGVDYGLDPAKDVSIRVITDHIRSTAFMLSDGVLPSNEGRGYVLRRLIRRAIRHGMLLGISGDFLGSVAEKAIEASSSAYPNLLTQKEAILKIIGIEEQKFGETIASGIAKFNEVAQRSLDSNSLLISGRDAFVLYDTYGFPYELTDELASELNLSIEIEGFQAALLEQKERSRKARSVGQADGWMDRLEEIASTISPTSFVGYAQSSVQASVVAIAIDGELAESLSEGESGIVFFDATPFYARSGGQIGDTGTARGESFECTVTDTYLVGDKYAHSVSVSNGELKQGQSAVLEIDFNRRMDIQRNHTSTHLLHKALRSVLGAHVNQAGSEVSAQRLRFDFSHYEKLSTSEIAQIEEIVNSAIYECMPVDIFEASYQEAASLGATMLFGEKYGDTVRVVRIGDFSIELCGGCHLGNTGFAGGFKIVSEAGIAQGVRRIEAITGTRYTSWANDMEEKLAQASALLKSAPEQLVDRIAEVLDRSKQLERQIAQYQSSESEDLASSIAQSKVSYNGISTLAASAPQMGVSELRDLGDKLKGKLGECALFLVSELDGRASMVCMATASAIESGFNCGSFIKKVAESVGSSGGGTPSLAQGGLRDASKAQQALENAKQFMDDQFASLK
ncbi:MAG: alanine--tRNA ligase [Eubacteriaceae bacterium]|nr:alanine--tRNA ligase [Eubacteriaceae bacterium]